MKDVVGVAIIVINQKRAYELVSTSTFAFPPESGEVAGMLNGKANGTKSATAGGGGAGAAEPPGVGANP